jgi:hypothetical protein
MSENPFNFARPAKGDNFYNRGEETKEAFGFIRSSQSFSVIGERRIGKTSFLEHILSEEVFKKNEMNFNKYIIICISLGSLPEISQEALARAIIDDLKENIEVGTQSEDVLEELDQWVKELAFKKKKLILALDEFEIAENIIDCHFSYRLKSILEHSSLFAITASRNTVAEISPNGKASPLFNVFGNLFLSLFSKEETEEMIYNMFSRGDMKIEEEEISYLTELSGRNPYLIQYLGFNYYEEREKIGRVDQIEFESRMSSHLKNYFENCWKHLPDNEKKFLVSPKGTDSPIGYILKRKGYLIEENGRWKIPSMLWDDFVQEKKKGRIQRFLKCVQQVASRVSLISLVGIILLFFALVVFHINGEVTVVQGAIGAVIAGLIIFLLPKLLRKSKSQDGRSINEE